LHVARKLRRFAASHPVFKSPPSFHIPTWATGFVPSGVSVLRI
jgi:hypothetical protein